MNEGGKGGLWLFACLLAMASQGMEWYACTRVMAAVKGPDLHLPFFSSCR